MPPAPSPIQPSVPDKAQILGIPLAQLNELFRDEWRKLCASNAFAALTAYHDRLKQTGIYQEGYGERVPSAAGIAWTLLGETVAREAAPIGIAFSDDLPGTPFTVEHNDSDGYTVVSRLTVRTALDALAPVELRCAATHDGFGLPEPPAFVLSGSITLEPASGGPQPVLPLEDALLGMRRIIAASVTEYSDGPLPGMLSKYFDRLRGSGVFTPVEETFAINPAYKVMLEAICAPLRRNLFRHGYCLGGSFPGSWLSRTGLGDNRVMVDCPVYAIGKHLGTLRTVFVYNRERFETAEPSLSVVGASPEE